MSSFLACGIAGAALDRDERRLLAAVRPGGVVLFARNVADREQLRALVTEVRALPGRPYVAVDLEGGRVNRLEKLVGPLPAPAQAARVGMPALRALGRAIGATCAHFGITVDFAPVLDVARTDGWVGSESRCLGDDPASVRLAAAEYLAGLEGFGVAACLKHYPGLGSGAVDSHRELPLLDGSVREDVEVFHALTHPQRAVMVAHALAPALGEEQLPASLSAAVIGPLRDRPCGPVLADDLEMGALAAYGGMADRAIRALAAGCDQVLVCNALEARREVADEVASLAERDPATAERLQRIRGRVKWFAREAPPEVPWPLVAELAERARTLAGGLA